MNSLQSSSVLSDNASLTTTSPPITAINSPTNTRYAYGIWVYVNSWDNTKEKVIFSRKDNISLTLDTNKPSLYCNVTMSDTTTINKTLITDNFPLQKWVFVIVSIDNQFLDCYLDGKLVKSTRLYRGADTGSIVLLPAIPPKETTPIILGSTPFDAVVASFTRWITPMDPQTAWNAYMAGNSNGSIMPNISSFGANLFIVKNNLAYSNVKLF